MAKTCLKGVGENRFLETLILDGFRTIILSLKFPSLENFLLKGNQFFYPLKVFFITDNAISASHIFS